MARRGSSGGGSESNTGLIVTLVFFILATITLGVFTYFGYDGQKELTSKAKSAETAKRNADNERDEDRMKRAILRIGIGISDTTDETVAKGNKSRFEASFDKEVASLKELPKWDPATNYPTNEKGRVSYVTMVDDLRKKVGEEEGLKNTQARNVKEAQTQLASEKDENEKLKAKMEDSLKKANEATVQAQAFVSKAFMDANTKIEELSKELAKLRQELQDTGAVATRDQKKLEGKIDGLNKQLEEAKSKLPQPNSMANDTPRGKIIKVDKDVVYIDLGSADFVRPQLAFSIVSADATGRSAAKKDVKGSLEIITVLEPHMSTARLTEVVSPIRDPILKGDLLFNPAWNSTQRVHVALTGIIDLDGDGKDDTAEIIRNLERQGIVVDTYLDLRERANKGPGITERTSYLVMGERPQLALSITPDPNNPVVVAFEDIIRRIGESEAKAKEMGVEKVNYRRFLTLIGYRLPKVTQPLDMTNTSYLRTAGSLKEGEKKDEAKK